MRVKICGMTSPAAVAHAAREGASYVGLVFYPPSPRSLDFARAREIAAAAPAEVTRVALVVDAEDAFLEALVEAVPVDMLQLHGAETPERVAEVRARFGLPVMKAVGIRDEDDLARIPAFEAVADQLLIDARPPRGSKAEGGEYLPGGNALSFDWRLIAGRRWTGPWMLAGGLTPANVADAVRLTGAERLDVSSGVESAPGVKDLDRISVFLRAALAAEAEG